MTPKIKAIAAVGVALVMAIGGARWVMAQRPGFAGRRAAVSPERFSFSNNSNTLIGVTSPGKDAIKVYNIADGTWSGSYHAPEGTTLQPIGALGYIVALPEGPRITQLAAYGIQAKAWVVLDLKEPVAGRMEAHFCNMGMAAFIAGRRVYAFSSAACKWDVLELPEEATPAVNIGQGVATVLHDGILHIFNAKFGRWDSSGDTPR